MMFNNFYFFNEVELNVVRNFKNKIEIKLK